MNKRWLLTGLFFTIGLGTAYLIWQGVDKNTPFETIQAPESAVKSTAIPPMDQLTYRKIESATFAMG